MMSLTVYDRRMMLRRWSDLRISISAVLLVAATMGMQACADDQSPDAVVHVVEVTPPQATVQVGPGQTAIYMVALNGGNRLIVPAGGRNPVWIRRP